MSLARPVVGVLTYDHDLEFVQGTQPNGLKHLLLRGVDLSVAAALRDESQKFLEVGFALFCP